jgi:ATP-dependent DNA helicase RecQ
VQTDVANDLRAILARHWGIDELRPLQEPAINAVLEDRDSLVVLPTGGGKSLCYQAPAVLRESTTVVVSPLISLMKDQVDGLQSCGVRALQLNSSLTPKERMAYTKEIRQGGVRLLFISPERLAQFEMCELLREIDVRTFAIDEAHCISQWGHDFRPEYRQLAHLKETFPLASVHAYTATATESVRRDIIQQLGLRDPEVLIGDFDRPNLTYLVSSRREPTKQIMEVIGRHRDEGGIVYCLRRSDVDELAAALKKQGVNALPYHAGLSPQQRNETQDAFTTEQCDVVVATVAFGMGIDRSNVRYVVHAGLPRSLEHYQQETGRAGRDGLEAECVMLYSGADLFVWKSIIEKSGSEPGVDPNYVPNSLKQLRDMDTYCRAAACRHRLLVRHFGQDLSTGTCGSACDICLGYTVPVPDAEVVAQKILSCVARVKDRYGVGHIVSVLRGENTENVRNRQHDKLSTYGLLKGHNAADLRDWIYQLISQEVLVQEEVETSFGRMVPVIRLNAASWEVMRAQQTVRLLQVVRGKKGGEPSGGKPRRGGAALGRPGASDFDPAGASDEWTGSSSQRHLFEQLRALRKHLAQEQHVPPYVIFPDATLREMASQKPSTLAQMRRIHGVGDVKLSKFGQQFLDVLHQS